VEYLDVHRFIQQEGWKPDYLGAAEWPVPRRARRCSRSRCPSLRFLVDRLSLSSRSGRYIGKHNSLVWRTNRFAKSAH
jgi:hypothetical protein